MGRVPGRLLGTADALALAAAGFLLAVVAGSVLARLLFELSGGAVNLLIPGAIELASHGLLVMIFSALPRAAVSGMVRVEILAARLPDPVARALERLWALGLAVFAGLLAWLLGGETMLQAARGDETQDLSLPLAWITGYAAAASAFVALVAGLVAIGGPGAGRDAGMGARPGAGPER